MVEGVLDYEKPVLITVVTTFDSYRTAPRQVGYSEFLEQLIVSDRARQQLPQYIQNAVGGMRFIEGIHVRLVFTPKKPMLLVGFGADSPTPSPSSNVTAGTPLELVGNENTMGEEGGGWSPSGEMGIQYVWSLIVCAVVGGMILML